MAGKKNRWKGSGKLRSSSTPYEPPPPTASASSANHHAKQLTKLIANTTGLNTLIVLKAEPATLRKLTELRDNMALISSEYTTHSITVRDEKESLYWADPVFISFPASGVDYELGPTQELEDVLRDTVSKLSAASAKASQLHTESGNIHVKCVLEGTSWDLAALTNSFSMRIERVRQQSQDNKAANVVTPRSVDVERLISALVDKLSFLAQLLAAFRTDDKKMMETVTSEARSLEKISLFFLRPKEGSREVSSLSVDTVRYHRKIERRLDFIFYQISLTMFKLIPLLEKKNSGNARAILEHLDNVAETLWAAREIVRRRESSVDEFCRLMVERNAMRAGKRTKREG